MKVSVRSPVGILRIIWKQFKREYIPEEAYPKNTFYQTRARILSSNNFINISGLNKKSYTLAK